MGASNSFALTLFMTVSTTEKATDAAAGIIDSVVGKQRNRIASNSKMNGFELSEL